MYFLIILILKVHPLIPNCSEENITKTCLDMALTIIFRKLTRNCKNNYQCLADSSHLLGQSELKMKLQSHFGDYIFASPNVKIHSLSGVATGWHGWTMSRGPELKGPPRGKKKKKMKNRKKKKEEQNFSNTWTGPPPDTSPWVLSRWQKIPKSNIGNNHTIFEI